jgi:Gpi18-like mannosyltransferase
MLFGGSIRVAKSSFSPWHLYCLHIIGELITEVGNIFLEFVLANFTFMVFAFNVNKIVDEVKVADNASAFEDILDFVIDSFGRNKYV